MKDFEIGRGLYYMLSYLGIQELGEKTTKGETITAQAAIVQRVMDRQARSITADEKKALLTIENLFRDVVKKQKQELRENTALDESARDAIHSAAQSNLEAANQIGNYLKEVSPAPKISAGKAPKRHQ